MGCVAPSCREACMLLALPACHLPDVSGKAGRTFTRTSALTNQSILETLSLQLQMSGRQG